MQAEVLRIAVTCYVDAATELTGLEGELGGYNPNPITEEDQAVLDNARIVLSNAEANFLDMLAQFTR